LEDARQLSRKQGVPLDVYTYHTVTRSQRQITLQGAREPQARPGHAVCGAVTFEPAAIVNAAGPWVDHTLAQLQIPMPQLMGGTKGSHFLTRDARLRDALAGRGIYTEAPDGRPVFLLPFGPWSLVGTTDLPCAASPETVTATDDELAYLLQAARDVFPHIHLTRADIDVHYCGVRPLPKVSASTPAAITRRHVLHAHDDPHVPVLSVVGGKLTTCRALAEDVAAWVLQRLGRSVQANSQDRIVPGGEAYPATFEQVTAAQSQIARDSGLSLRQVSAVWDLCGTRTASMLAPTTGAAGAADDRRSLSGTDLPVRFVRRVLQDEWCCHLTDLVERRLMLLYHPELTRACLEDLTKLMVEQGLVRTEEARAELEQCITRLRQHFGREVTGCA
jgi:glycerol-3-phosphate dehydrogenase